MVVYKEGHYIEMLDSLKEILDNELDDIRFDTKVLKKALSDNCNKERILLRSYGLRDDIRSVIDTLQEIMSLTEELDSDIEDYDEKKREEYTSAFHRMFSLP